jgi:ABC-type transporter Mla subunit MlaD
MQGDSISRVFDDPKGLFASAPVNLALTKSKSRDSSEKLVGAAAAAAAAAAVTAGYAATVADVLSLMCSLCLYSVLRTSQRANE